MANYTVSPQALVFNKATVQGPVAALYATPQTLSFKLTNNSGASVKVTNYGFSTSTNGDAVTQPAGIYTNSDFTVAVHSGSFPVTITNGSSQQFDVTYAPLRRGSSFGDIRSAILTLFSGNQALVNGTPVYNTVGEVVDLLYPVPITVGVGGGVLEEGYNYSTTAPVYGDTSHISRETVTNAGVVSYTPSSPVNMTIADLDTGRHAVSAIELYSGTGAGTSVAGGVVVRARGVQVLVYGLDTASHIDLEIDVVLTGGPTLVYKWTGLTYSTVSGLFLGNAEGIDLQGMNLYAQVTNVTNPNTNTIKIGVVVTG